MATPSLLYVIQSDQPEFIQFQNYQYCLNTGYCSWDNETMAVAKTTLENILFRTHFRKQSRKRQGNSKEEGKREQKEKQKKRKEKMLSCL